MAHSLALPAGALAPLADHCLAFRLSAADVFHHLLFVSILCGLGIRFKQVGGVANNFGILDLDPFIFIIASSKYYIIG